jgi:uncharacterized Ntn-hydrolase superfamily protein
VTYSIIASDPRTGQFGVAVATHWIGVGNSVPHASAFGAVATQAATRADYGPELLAALARGETADAALARALAEDDGCETRQVAVVDRLGNVAAHTGSGAIGACGHRTGAGFSCQANLVVGPVWEPMADAFEHAEGDLATRMLVALHAAERAGGDRRGQQSAAVLVVDDDAGRGVNRVDLRVDDHPSPLDELNRLLLRQRAYTLAAHAVELCGQGDVPGALALLDEVDALHPDGDETRLWSALALIGAGAEREGRERLRQAVARNPRWADTLPALSKVAPQVGAFIDALPDSADPVG